MLSDSPSQYVFQRSYDDFDHLVSDMRRWDLDLRQIDCGSFRGETLQFGLEDMHVAEGRFGRTLEQRGAPPIGMRTIGIPANQSVKFVWRGQHIDGHSMLVFPRGAELASVSSPDFHIYTCSFSENLLDAAGEWLQISGLDQLRGTSEVIHCCSELMKPLQDHLRILCDSVRREQNLLSDRCTQRRLRLDLARRLLSIIANSEGVRIPATSQKRDSAIARAQSYIERHARDPISVTEICTAAGVSQRTLEYAFDERFGVTPKAFLLVYRLNMIRRELCDSAPSTTTKVVHIANEYEFWHMGRFAAKYRQLFQELPSETLERTGVVPLDCCPLKAVD